MPQNWYLIFAVALFQSFLISVLLTAAVRRLALRWNIVDRPGERKMHSAPIPLMGGVAIYLAFNVSILGSLLAFEIARQSGFEWLQLYVRPYLGDYTVRGLTGIFAGAFLIFLLGVVDDLKALSPEVKLIGQIVAAAVLVLSGIRADVFTSAVIEWLPFTDNLSEYSLTVINVAVSGLLTMVWVVMMTNSMNFLDNMDGLCAGVSIIAALSFFLCVVPGGENFVAALLMVFAGSVAGFLYHNFHPARIFMGDAGAMFCGYILATVALLGTFYTEETGSRIAVAAPLLALCVPLFDTVSVVYIRWRRGESIMKGDKRHFSHRLVELGMTHRQAVEFIYLVAIVTGLGGALLPKLGTAGTLIILGQTAGVFLLIVLLMQAGAPRAKDSS